MSDFGESKEEGIFSITDLVCIHWLSKLIIPVSDLFSFSSLKMHAFLLLGFLFDFRLNLFAKS